ncbi:hypothetical protein DNTS_032685, partial [Danionella cerebrum]
MIALFHIMPRFRLWKLFMYKPVTSTGDFCISKSNKLLGDFKIAFLLKMNKKLLGDQNKLQDSELRPNKHSSLHPFLPMLLYDTDINTPPAPPSKSGLPDSLSPEPEGYGWSLEEYSAALFPSDSSRYWFAVFGSRVMRWKSDGDQTQEQSQASSYSDPDAVRSKETQLSFNQKSLENNDLNEMLLTKLQHSSETHQRREINDQTEPISPETILHYDARLSASVRLHPTIEVKKPGEHLSESCVHFCTTLLSSGRRCCIRFEDQEVLEFRERESKKFIVLFLSRNSLDGKWQNPAQDEFLCAVCLDLLKDPVTVPCGHSFCRICISGFWDQEDQKRVSRCPQCRHTYSSRPALAKNIMLDQLMEKLKKSRAQAAGAAQSPAGPGDVECDLCPGAKIKAVKSCLVCLNSYCQTHFERHQEFHPGKRHTVIEATGRLQEMICPRHEKLLEIFCRTDQCCVCYLCVVDEHKTHDTVSVGAARAEKQEQLEETQRSVRQRIQERQKELEELKEGIEAHKRSADTAVEETQSICSQLIRSIEERCSELQQKIRDGEEASVSRAQERMKRLEQEIHDLRRRNTELEKLSLTDHHLHFLQSFQSLSDDAPGSSGSSSGALASPLTFDQFHEFVPHWRKEMDLISARVRSIDIVPPQPESRQELLQCKSLLRAVQKMKDLQKKALLRTLLRNTRHTELKHIRNNLMVTALSAQRGEAPAGAESSLSLASQESDLQLLLLLQHEAPSANVWKPLPELECSARGFHPALVKFNRSRASAASLGSSHFQRITLDPNTVHRNLLLSEGNRAAERTSKPRPYPDHPERFDCYPQVLGRESLGGRSYWEVELGGAEGKATELPGASRGSRIGVYVDRGAGILSFYSVSHTMSLIHSIRTSFTEPLYPGFGFRFRWSRLKASLQTGSSFFSAEILAAIRDGDPPNQLHLSGTLLYFKSLAKYKHKKQHLKRISAERLVPSGGVRNPDEHLQRVLVFFIPVSPLSLLPLKPCRGFCVPPPHTDNTHSTDPCGRRSPAASHAEGRSSPAVVQWLRSRIKLLMSLKVSLTVRVQTHQTGLDGFDFGSRAEVTLHISRSSRTLSSSSSLCSALLQLLHHFSYYNTVFEQTGGGEQSSSLSAAASWPPLPPAGAVVLCAFFFLFPPPGTFREMASFAYCTDTNTTAAAFPDTFVCSYKVSSMQMNQHLSDGFLQEIGQGGLIESEHRKHGNEGLVSEAQNTHFPARSRAMPAVPEVPFSTYMMLAFSISCMASGILFMSCRRTRVWQTKLKPSEQEETDDTNLQHHPSLLVRPEREGEEIRHTSDRLST